MSKDPFKQAQLAQARENRETTIVLQSMLHVLALQ